MKLIDSHFHIFTADTPLKSDLWKQQQWPAPLEDIRALFGEFGIERGVIATSSQYGLHKDYFAAALRAHDDMRATVNLALDTTPAELAALADQGFVGTRLLWRPLDETPDPNSAEYQRLFKRCADIGWHVHFADRPHRIDRTIRALEASGVRVVVDHMGLVDTPEGVEHEGFIAILKAMERGRTWVKLAGGFRLKQADPDAFAVALVAAGGWERLMWASDWPFVGYQGQYDYRRAVEALAHWAPDADMQQRIGYDTAEKFYFSK